MFISFILLFTNFIDCVQVEDLLYPEGIFRQSMPVSLTHSSREWEEQKSSFDLSTGEELDCGMFTLTIFSQPVNHQNLYIRAVCFSLENIISSRFLYDEQERRRFVRVRLELLPMGDRFLGKGGTGTPPCKDAKDGLYRTPSFYRMYPDDNTFCEFQRKVSSDIYININIQREWYFGLDALCPEDKYDLVTTITHEVMHGFAFTSFAQKDGYDIRDGIYFLDQAFDKPLILYDDYSEVLRWAITPKNFVYQNFGDTGRKYPKQPSYSPEHFVRGVSNIHYQEIQWFPPPTCRSLNFPFCNNLMTRSLKKGYAIHRLGGNTLNFLDNMGFLLKDCRLYSGNQSACLANYCDYCLSNRECGLIEMADYIWGTCPSNDWKLAVLFSSASSFPSLF